MNYLRQLLVCIPVAAALDLLWLGVLARGFYIKRLGHLMRVSSAGPETFWPSAAGVYLVLALGIVFFVLPRSGGSLVATACWGGFFGLVAYGIYEFTNYALLKGWPGAVVVVDILWGAVICALASVVTAYAAVRFGWR